MSEKTHRKFTIVHGRAVEKGDRNSGWPEKVTPV